MTITTTDAEPELCVPGKRATTGRSFYNRKVLHDINKLRYTNINDIKVYTLNLRFSECNSRIPFGSYLYLEKLKILS